jgi:hypothetical protein
MEKKDWIYTLILFLAMGLIQAVLSFTSKWLIQFEFFTPPTFLLRQSTPDLTMVSFRILLWDTR